MGICLTATLIASRYCFFGFFFFRTSPRFLKHILKILREGPKAYAIWTNTTFLFSSWSAFSLADTKSVFRISLMMFSNGLQDLLSLGWWRSNKQWSMRQSRTRTRQRTKQMTLQIQILSLTNLSLKLSTSRAFWSILSRTWSYTSLEVCSVFWGREEPW